MEDKKGRLHVEKKTIPKITRFISADQILVQTAQGWYIGRRKLAKEEISALKTEAEQFSNSYLWDLMRKDIHYMAYLQATAKRRTDEDAIYAGAMYYNLELLEKFMAHCKRL